MKLEHTKEKWVYRLLVVLFSYLFQKLLIYLWPYTGLGRIFWWFLNLIPLLFFISITFANTNKWFLRILTPLFVLYMFYFELDNLPQERGNPMKEFKESVKILFNINDAYEALRFENLFMNKIESQRDDVVIRIADEYKFRDSLPEKRATLFFERNYGDELVKKIYIWKQNEELFYNDPCLVLLDTVEKKYCFVDSCINKTASFCIDTGFVNFAPERYGSLLLSFYTVDSS